jgi:hypothetical protein
MILKLIEATNIEHGGVNWGKFMLMQFDTEWSYRSVVADGLPLLRVTGWSRVHIWVADLQTGEGGFFYPKGDAKADLDEHRLWVCPMFEPFLIWLYKQDLTDIGKLPALVQIEDPTSALAGYRRNGPTDVDRVARAMHKDAMARSTGGGDLVPWEEAAEVVREAWRHHARAAIKAL